MIARQQGWGLAEVATQAHAPVLGTASLKTALDRDWDDPEAGQEALTAVEQWVESQAESKDDPAIQASMQAAQQLKVAEKPF